MTSAAEQQHCCHACDADLTWLGRVAVFHQLLGVVLYCVLTPVSHSVCPVLWCSVLDSDGLYDDTNCGYCAHVDDNMNCICSTAHALYMAVC